MESSVFRYEGRDAFYQRDNRHYGRSVLLLHGYSFNSDVWQKARLYDTLLEAGFNVFGIDVPGFPNSRSRFSLEEEDMVRFLKKFADEKIEGGELVLLGSSASCGFALKFAEYYSNALHALILVGPAGVEDTNPERIKADTLVIWGSEDRLFAKGESTSFLERIKKEKTLVIEGAGHACYLDKPKEFNNGIAEFLKKI